MPMKVMSTETGIEIATTRVDRTENRKTKMMITAKPRPSSPSCARLLIDWVIDGAWSATTTNLVLLPSCFSRVGRSLRTRFDTDTVLPAADLVTLSETAGLPLTLE